MLICTSTVDQEVIAVFGAMSADPAMGVSRDTEVLAVFDSLAIFTALVNLQDRLAVSLEPAQLHEIFQCATLGDIVLVLESVMAKGEIKSKSA